MIELPRLRIRAEERGRLKSRPKERNKERNKSGEQYERYKRQRPFFECPVPSISTGEIEVGDNCVRVSSRIHYFSVQIDMKSWNDYA